ncbi:peptidase M23-like protein [Actinocorallia herbida]|uniref:Peptidase M23-like protein n=1 Tax=Actinocorallia herbida TaxID=58109 RepID=A0A3N1CQ36_9ACTN|nr:M23 family metallopeptidase [Actinocorallia herbida]ROO83412.1 peptidase M23-like protein [Actinocorallia herbida]
MITPSAVLVAVLSAAPPLPSPAGWPLEPPFSVVRGFDPPARDWLAGHRGVDLLAGAPGGAPGGAVLAGAEGIVTFAGPVFTRGVVTISHGAYRTTYEPVLPLVRPGARVVAGQRIGTLAAGPSHCAPATCLHWGLRHGAAYLDPLGLPAPPPIILLPLGP